METSKTLLTPRLNSIPDEVKKGWKKVPDILAYLRDLATAQIVWDRVKLIFVGQEAAGKTSLKRVMVEGKTIRSKNKEAPVTYSTDGIDISEWTPPRAPGGTPPPTFSTWDFGGQQVFYPTHQLFLTSRSIYICVFDLCDVNLSRLDYWIKQVKYRAGNPKCFIVGTHIDDPKCTKAWMEGVEQKLGIYRQLPFVKSILFVSAKTGLGIAELTEGLILCAQDQTLLKQPIPASWYNLDSIIRATKLDGVAYMDRDSFLKLCADAEIRHESIETVITFLHDVGTITHYRPDRRDMNKDIYVLDSQWLATLMASIISFKQGWVQNGLLSIDKATMSWKGRYGAHMYETILGLLERFEVIFPIKTDNAHARTILIPSLLEEAAPRTIDREWFTFGETPPSVIRYRRLYTFEFLPLGFFSRLLVRLYHLRDVVVTTSWQTGVVLRFSTERALVIYREKEYTLEFIVETDSTLLPEGFRGSLLLRQLVEVTELVVDLFYNGTSLKRRVPCNQCERVLPPHQVKLGMWEMEDVIYGFQANQPMVCQSCQSKLAVADFAPDIAMTDISAIDVLRRLRIEKEIGSGGFGKVYKGVLDGDIPVAIKELKGESTGEASEDINQFNSFQREAVLMSKLDHPNCVRLYGISSNPLYMIMEFVSSGDLFHYIKNARNTRQDISWDLRLLIALDVAKGMKYLQGLDPPIIHRDLRSPNVFLENLTTSRAGVHAKVADFGLSRIVLSNVSGMLATWQWLAPEVFDYKSDTYTLKADVYSFAMVCYELAALNIPFDEYHEAYTINGEHRVQRLKRDVVEKDLRPTLPPQTPAAFANMVRKCWTSDPPARPEFAKTVDWLLDMIYVKDTATTLEAAAPVANTGSKFTFETKWVPDHTAEVTAICYCPKTETIWTGSRDGLLTIWALDGFSRIESFKAHDSSVVEIVTLGDSVWTCAGTHIRTWDETTRKKKKEYKKHDKEIKAMKVVQFAEAKLQQVALTSTPGTEPKFDFQKSTSIVTGDAAGVLLHWKKSNLGYKPSRLGLGSPIFWIFLQLGILWVGTEKEILEMAPQQGTLIVKYRTALPSPPSTAVIKDDELWYATGSALNVWNITVRFLLLPLCPFY